MATSSTLQQSETQVPSDKEDEVQRSSYEHGAQNAANTLKLLAEASLLREQDLANFSRNREEAESDKGDDSEGPIMDAFERSEGLDEIRVATNFTKR